jgi:hypothetical protein
VAGSYGGVAFMVAAVLFIAVIIVLLGWPTSMYLLQQSRGLEPGGRLWTYMGMCFTAAAALSIGTWWFSMRAGVRALERMDRTPS